MKNKSFSRNSKLLLLVGLLISAAYSAVLPQNFGFQTLQETLNLGAQPLNLLVSNLKPVTFEGKYSTNLLDNANLIISFYDNRVGILNGCNTFNGQYEADTLGNIEFKNMFGTKKACEKDNDFLYLEALTKSVTY